MTEERARQAELYLVGMVCYYGKHYSTFFFQTKIRKWMYFDDAHVKEVRHSLDSACCNTGTMYCTVSAAAPLVPLRAGTAGTTLHLSFSAAWSVLLQRWRLEIDYVFKV